MIQQSSKLYFDQLGEDWDPLRERFFSNEVRERALDLAAVQQGLVAADLGAGTGFVSEALVDRGLDVIAVDRSRPMLEALRAKLADTRAIECRVGDVERLPLRDGEVDYSFANMLLHHVEKPSQAIREMTRIVKPGGLVVISDLDRHDHEFLVTEHHDRWMGFEREDIRAWFSEAGLSRIRIEDANSPCRATSTGGIAAVTSIFIAIGVA